MTLHDKILELGKNLVKLEEAITRLEAQHNKKTIVKPEVDLLDNIQNRLDELGKETEARKKRADEIEVKIRELQFNLKKLEKENLILGKCQY